MARRLGSGLSFTTRCSGRLHGGVLLGAVAGSLSRRLTFAADIGQRLAARCRSSLGQSSLRGGIRSRTTCRNLWNAMLNQRCSHKVSTAGPESWCWSRLCPNCWRCGCWRCGYGLRLHWRSRGLRCSNRLSWGSLDESRRRGSQCRRSSDGSTTSQPAFDRFQPLDQCRRVSIQVSAGEAHNRNLEVHSWIRCLAHLDN